MLFYTRCLFKSQTKKLTDSRWWLGLMLVITLASISIALSKLSVLQNAQVSSLTIGIILGIIVGNSLFSRIATHTDIGVDYAKSFLLKAGIILFGFRTHYRHGGIGTTNSHWGNSSSWNKTPTFGKLFVFIFNVRRFRN